MRPLGLLLCVSACTLDNPAFFVTDTEAGSASSAASADPTRPTSTTNGSTTASSDASGSTTDEPATTTGTSANVSASDVTTDPPATSSTTDESTTTTTDTQPMTVTSDTTGPVSCGLIDVIPPLLALHLADENQPPTPEDCLSWQGKEFAGKLEATLGGFKILADQACPSMNVPGDGFKFDISLPDVPSHNFECVELRFAVHPGKCLVSAVTVTHGGLPVLTGSFGRHEFEPPFEPPFEPQYEPSLTCGACPGCCPNAPDPDIYNVKLDDKPVIEGGKLMFVHESKQHMFYNVRSHVHGPECLDKQLSPPDWLHFDWVVLRLE